MERIVNRPVMMSKRSTTDASWGEMATIIAAGYLRLLQRHGPNWREGRQLREKAEDSSRIRSFDLTSSAIDRSGVLTLSLRAERS